MCYRWMENNCEKLKICTPKSLRDVVLWHIHDSETSRHLEIRRTYAKLWRTVTTGHICDDMFRIMLVHVTYVKRGKTQAVEKGPT